MSYPSLAPYIMKRPWLMRWMRPLSEWYFDNAGYRKLGLRADDLIPEEDEIVQQALKRLSPKEAYDRVFRMRRAFQCSLSHQLLPKAEWTKTNDDYPYLQPIIREITAEQTEREDLESMIINKRKAAPKGSSPNIESKH
ncbi:hypothetical protein D0869_08637 [Hortaea werneckii]|uniref:Cytochrome b-c1 complex subunit 7 n=1 Tax=Hortaea werneckii TaxID=91943 RepID=A0A3M7EN57_HORWE|nr:hypothetical protein KC324_g13021 [Hortaea werneckii]KAI7233856.1 hypothetical protein KC330_g5116 [Hortaea werneckii]KAI7559602.1 hypothetical protein KC316_g13111 [Hortaea werneckii]RMX78992.1 hypothetical protein D0869_08637 [Hortaea werneckii]RMY77636.1 hypothetical protein D0862_13524 [Hortaea werneckii]